MADYSRINMSWSIPTCADLIKAEIECIYDGVNMTPNDDIARAKWTLEWAGGAWNRFWISSTVR